MLRWLAAHEDPRSVALFRIAFALLLAADVATFLPHVGYLYGPDAVVPSAVACTGLTRATAMCLLPGTAAAYAILVGCILAALALAIGFHTRIAKWLAAYLFLSIILRNGIALAGEQVFGNFLFLLCLSRCDAAYSIDAWRRGTTATVPAWPRHLMILQLCLAYGVAGWAKQGPSWIDGSALYWVVANDRWVRFEPWWLLSTFATNAMRLATWGAWWFERTFPLVILCLVSSHRVARIGRTIFAALSLVFTGTLVLLLNVGWFVPATLAATLLLFRGEEIGAVIDRLLRTRNAVAPSPPSRPSPLLVALVLAHAFAMIVNALSLPHLRLPMPEPIRTATRAWARGTNTWQFWGMFSPDVPHARTWLVVDAVDRDGHTHAVFDDRELVGRRPLPYVFIDRREKAHAKAQDPDGGYTRLHAQYLCRTWSDPNGHPPTRVVLSQWGWPLPTPRWHEEHGAADPRPHFEHMREVAELLVLDCSH